MILSLTQSHVLRIQSSWSSDVRCILLQQVCQHLIDSLGELPLHHTSLFNECVSSGSIPKVWKTAQVTALHKKGPKWEACNYRPISLTCILCKVFEKVVRNHVMNHFLPYVSDTQHGFLKGKSCLSNLFECFDKIDEIVNSGGDPYCT